MGLCVGVLFPEMSHCLVGLWISREAKGQGLMLLQVTEARAEYIFSSCSKRAGYIEAYSS